DEERGRRLLREAGLDASRLPVVIRYDGKALVAAARAAAFRSDRHHPARPPPGPGPPCPRPAALRCRTGFHGAGNVAVPIRSPTLRRPPGMANTGKINI
ncbi:hypothetical protein AB0K34_39005, partial [Actinomadura sp. NPDC049382]|uniref:hypothetical protein n=1 Tax=Actinomadura sp. NPDC049382 TaxID=3158220 RepID=UPI00343E98D0